MNEFKRGIVVNQEETFGKLYLLDGAETVYRETQQRGRREREARMYKMECEKMPDVQLEVYIREEDKSSAVRFNFEADAEKAYKLIDPFAVPGGTGRSVGFVCFAKDIVEA